VAYLSVAAIMLDKESSDAVDLTFREGPPRPPLSQTTDPILIFHWKSSRRVAAPASRRTMATA
jgi:hypothetical protein